MAFLSSTYPILDIFFGDGEGGDVDGGGGWRKMAFFKNVNKTNQSCISPS